MTKKAGCYIRVSTQDQAEDDKASLSAQRADSETVCQHYAIADWYQDTERYRATRGKDRGKVVEPSSERKDRPQYLRLCEDIRQGKIDVVVAQCWDRLAAGGAIEVLLDAIEASPVEVIIHTAWEGTMNKMLLRIMCATRAEENERRRKRVLMAGKARLESGRAYGGYFRYGHCYDKETGTWSLNETEAPWVEKIYQWYTNGVTMAEIKRRLIEGGARQRKEVKRPWESHIIRKILNNPAYKGTVPVNWNGESYELECPRIVSDQLWQKAQDKLEFNNCWRNHNVKLHYLLSGLLVCGDCGNRLYASGARYRYENGGKFLRKTPIRRYKCEKEKWSVNANTIEQTVWITVCEVLERPDMVLKEIKQRLEERNANREERLKEAARLEQKLENLKEERQWCIIQARKGILTQSDFEQQIALLDTEQSQLEIALREVETEIPQDFDFEALYWQIVGRKGVLLREAEQDPEQKRFVVEMLLNEIEVDWHAQVLHLKGSFERVVRFKGPEAPYMYLDLLRWQLTADLQFA